MLIEELKILKKLNHARSVVAVNVQSVILQFNNLGLAADNSMLHGEGSPIVIGGVKYRNFNLFPSVIEILENLGDEHNAVEFSCSVLSNGL